MSRVRVLHVQKSSGIGGCERHLLDLLPALRDHGVDSTFLLMHTEGGERYRAALEERGVAVEQIPAGPDLNPAAIVRIAQHARRGRFSLLHTHLVHADVHGQVAARLARVPAVSSIHGTHAFYGREPSRSAARLAGHLARRTIAISQFAASHVAEHGIAPTERVRVIPYGLDAEHWRIDPARRVAARAERGFGEDDCVVVIASRLIPGKGHDELIEAVCGAPDDARIRLLVAGDGPLREELTAQARRADPDGARVAMLGFVADVEGLFAAADVVAFTTQPELSEGFGLAALEAHAAGLPVVATNIASLPEIVVDGVTGRLVGPHDVDALRAALVDLARDPERRQRLGAAAGERASELFSLSRMVDATIDCYREVLGPEMLGG